LVAAPAALRFIAGIKLIVNPLVVRTVKAALHSLPMAWPILGRVPLASP
jgi:hypothetical protein